MQIAGDLFEREDNRGQRRVERSGDRRGSSDWDEGLHSFGAQSEVPAENGSYPTPDLHRRPFAPQGDATCQCRRRAKELSKDRTKSDPAAPRK